jgi:hypothetical protein
MVTPDRVVPCTALDRDEKDGPLKPVHGPAGVSFHPETVANLQNFLKNAPKTDGERWIGVRESDLA